MRLKQLLQTMDASAFEAMVVQLVGSLISVRFTQAQAGSQDGGDGGTIGRLDRRIRVEAKRYSSSFDARDLLGGLTQAIARDPSLEAWIACATRNVPEQLANALEALGAKEGVPVLTIAWDNEHTPQLAALCTQDITLVTEYAGHEAATLAANLALELSAALVQLRHELAAWQIGFDQLRTLTHIELEAMWGSKRTALARFGQDVAGGERRQTIQREAPWASLDNWWSSHADKDAPAAILGQGGAGKTWAAISWLLAHREDLPIVLTIPAGAVTAAVPATPDGLLRLLGGQLATITSVRDTTHWVQRVRRLLSRPASNGPALCLLIDGINQNPTIPWMRFLAILQDRPFAGTVRTMFTTRNQHFESDMSGTRHLVEKAIKIPVERFSDTDDGELDQMLAGYSLVRSDLSPDLIEFACVPRLFDLVVRLRERLIDTGRVTTHRLLWEYGRDSLGAPAGVSFSEPDWRAWLAEIARRERAGLRSYTLLELSGTTARPDLEASRIAARLSDIVDGNLTVPGSASTFQLVPEIVSHALGAALLEYLDSIARRGKTSVGAALAEWLDPISGLEERAELLRAATSIMAERDGSTAPEIAGGIMTAWLQTQNLPAVHLNEIRRLASHHAQPLLDTVEQSKARPQASARAAAIDALRGVPSNDPVVYGLIIATAVRWLSRVSRDVSLLQEGFEQVENHRSARLLKHIGVDHPGPVSVLGYSIDLIDHDDDDLAAAIVSILDGRPLVGATEVFVRIALATAIRSGTTGWEGFKWLCLLNEIDPEATAEMLRQASAEIATRPVESGVNPQLATRVGALLLWLTAQEADEEAAEELDPGIDHNFDYERDYLADPGASHFRLELRHARSVLARQDIAMRSRLQRAKQFLVDPTFDPPAEFVAEVRAVGAAFDVTSLDAGRFQTAQDHDLEELEVALARCAPDVLADLHRRKLAGYAARTKESFDSSAWSASEALLVADEAAHAGCRSLRERSMAAGGGINVSSPGDLLMVEIVELSAIEQIRAMLEAGLEFVSVDFRHVLKPLDAASIDIVLDENEGASPARIAILICVLSAADGSVLSERAWKWAEGLALDPDAKKRNCAFSLLFRCDAARLGRMLLDIDWNWAGETNDLSTHYGSLAIAAAGTSLPFEEIAPRIAPALLPLVVSERGAAPAETMLVAAILDRAIMRQNLKAPEPGSIITIDVDHCNKEPMRMSIAPGPMAGDDENPLASLLHSDEVRREHYKRAVETAVERVRDAHSAGASLYLTNIEADHLVPIISASPENVRRWMEGAAERSLDFMRRLRLGEGFYLALCEALLTSDPELGATLWRAMGDTMVTRYIGCGGVDERTLMLFRVPTSPLIQALRTSLLDLAQTKTDDRLLDIAVAAIAYGQLDWLNSVIEADSASPHAWRRRRGTFLLGFQTGVTLPVKRAELEGTDYTYEQERLAVAARRQARDAAARHWWRDFVGAPNVEAAFAAWTLFRHSADRRALAWLSQETWPVGSDDALSRRKKIQANLNYRAMSKEASKREDRGSGQFLDKSTTDNVAPWYNGKASGG